MFFEHFVLLFLLELKTIRSNFVLQRRHPSDIYNVLSQYLTFYVARKVCREGSHSVVCVVTIVGKCRDIFLGRPLVSI